MDKKQDDGVTLYVPAYNASRTLRECLEAVYKQSRHPDEVLVIDDGSTDDTAEIAKQCGAKVIKHEVNRGIAAARNTALKNASYPLIANLDSDAVPNPQWLEKLLAAFDEYIVGVGGKLIEKYQDDMVNRWRAVQMPQHWGDAPVDAPTFLFGAGALFRKSAIEAVGGYDERCRRNFEDNDLGLRLHQAGYNIRYTPEAVAYHLRRDTLSSLLMTSWGWSRRPRDATSLNYKVRKIIINFYTLGRKARRDFEERSLSLFALSLLVTLSNAVMDVRYFLTGREDPLVESAKVSVVIPAFNAGRWIKRTIESALNQTLVPHEVIVVDDGSTDETPNVIAGFKSDVRGFQQVNAGVGAARNLGLEKVTGDWIAFLDADDTWARKKLERAVAFASIVPDVALISHDAFVIDEQDQIVGAYRFAANAGENATKRLIQGNWINTSTVILRTKAARDAGLFRTDFKRKAGCEDWEYWIRVAAKYRVEHLREPLAFYRRLTGSWSRSGLDDLLDDSLNVVADMGARQNLTEAESRNARSHVFLYSAVRRLAAGDPASARRDLLEARKFAGWRATDTIMYILSQLPAGAQTLLLQIKRHRDARMARALMRKYERIIG